MDFNSHGYFILISDKYFQSLVIEGSIFPISYRNEQFVNSTYVGIHSHLVHFVTFKFIVTSH